LTDSGCVAQNNIFSTAHLAGTTGNCSSEKDKRLLPAPQTTRFGQCYNNTACGLNMVSGVVLLTTRFSGSAGTGDTAGITISALPASCIAIDKAYIWYVASYTEATAPNSTVDVTSPAGGAFVNYPAVMLQTGPAKCWNETGTVSYRADVSAAISGNGKYVFHVKGFASADHEVDGIALVIIYKDLSATYQGNLIIDDGLLVNDATASITKDSITGFKACATGANARAFFFGTDFQNNIGTGMHTTTLNGTTATYSNNFANFDDTTCVVQAGQTMAPYATTDVGDCYAWAMIGLYFQTTCAVCTGASFSLTPTVVPASCGGATGAASITPSGGTGPYTYSWSPVSGTGSSVNGLSAATYTVSVQDANRCMQTTTVVVAGRHALDVTIPSPVPPSCKGGADGWASVLVNGGTAPFTYSWSPGGGTAPTTNGLSAGTYTVCVKDVNGCSGTALVLINDPPGLVLSIRSVTAVSCNGGKTGAATVATRGGTGAYTYSWNPSAGNAAAIAGLSTGVEFVAVTDAKGCMISDSVLITEPAKLELKVSAVNPACAASATGYATVAVSGGTAAYSYSWYPAGGTSAATVKLAAGSYTVHIHDSNGCADSAIATLQAPPSLLISIVQGVKPSCFGGSNGSVKALSSGGSVPYSYSWFPKPGAGQGSALATDLIAGKYSCTLTDSLGCKDTVSFILTPPPVLTVTALHDATVCPGACMNLAATPVGGTPGYVFAWTANGNPVSSLACPAVTTTYTVTITDSAGCVSAPRSLKLHVAQPLLITTAPKRTLCCGDSLTLVSSVSGGNPGYTYAWTPAQGATNPQAPDTKIKPATSTTYTLLVTDNCYTTDTALVQVTVFPVPLPELLANSVAGCAPLCVTFNVSSTPSGTNATWIFGDGYTASGYGKQTHCFTTEDTTVVSYTVDVNITDSNGCTARLHKSELITVYPVPVARFTATPDPATMLHPTVTFNTPSAGQTTRLWSFGELNSSGSNLQNPSFTYADTGCFPVSLLLINQFGCRASTETPVCVVPDYEFFSPNAFTPNGDGRNDVFMPKGSGIDLKGYDFSVYDRWGNELFHTTSWGTGWDGHANNGTEVAQVDTYVWRVTLFDFAGNRHQYKGDVSLIR